MRVRVLVKSYINEGIHLPGDIIDVAELDGRVELLEPKADVKQPTPAKPVSKKQAKKPALPDFLDED